MKKLNKLLFIALISIGMFLTINVNAKDYKDEWYWSSDTEEVKTIKIEALDKIAKAIPDSITLDIKEIDATNDYDPSTGQNKVRRAFEAKIKQVIKDAGVTLPINLETTDDEGNKVTIKIDDIGAGVTPIDIDYENEKVLLDKNLSRGIVEIRVTTHYSGGGSDIVTTLKDVHVTYSDSNKRNDNDQKYVDQVVNKDAYMIHHVNEINLVSQSNEEYNNSLIESMSKLSKELKELIKDNSLEFKLIDCPAGMGDIDFGYEEWIVAVYKNGIVYKNIILSVVSTIKITVPSNVPDTKQGYLGYVNSLFAKSEFEVGKAISMEPIDDIKNHFTDGYEFKDNKGYYLFTFDDENNSKYAFKIVRENNITSVKLNKTSLSLVKGKTGKLSATINPSNTTDDKTLTWTSSNEKIATVDKNGNVKAIAAGSATITVKTSNGKTATAKITVTNPNTPITSVKINQKNPTVVIKKTTKLSATINPSNTTQSKALTWSSSNKKVATVDKNGVVKGIKAGTANITVKTSNGKTATVKVTVKKATPIKSVKLNKSSVKLEQNKTLQLKATVSPSNTTDDKTVTWSSSNKKVATVDKNGKITAVSAGSAKITVKTSNGKKKTIKVTVSKINAKKATITSIKNQTQTGKAIKPAVEVKLNGKTLKNGTDYTVTYKNNKNAGKATVTVKFKGNYTGTKTGSFLIIPKKVDIKNPSTAKKSITVKYSKVSGAKTYQIAYRIKGTKKWSYTTSKTASKKISKLTTGKQYEVMVRAGIKSGSKTLYGAWSNTKVIKVK